MWLNNYGIGFKKLLVLTIYFLFLRFLHAELESAKKIIFFELFFFYKKIYLLQYPSGIYVQYFFVTHPRLNKKL